MVEANPEQQDFIIRKAPMIRKNEQPLESVYRRDPKVSRIHQIFTFSHYSLATWKRNIWSSFSCNAYRNWLAQSDQRNRSVKDKELGALLDRGQNLTNTGK